MSSLRPTRQELTLRKPDLLALLRIVVFFDRPKDIPPGWALLAVQPMHELTQIVSAIEQGDPHPAEQRLPLVYEELRQLAAQKLGQEKPEQTLQAPALVQEDYVRLVDSEKA